jgi:hypothetical protein
VAAALVAVLGVLGINRSQLTPGVHGDSVEYLTAAESFRAGGTFTIPITHWSRADSVAELSHFPPGYSAVLSGVMRLGLPPQAAALWVTALAAGVVVAGVGLLVLPFGLLAATLSAGALLATPVFVRLHLAIWSEPLFMATTMLLVLALVRRPGVHWLHGLLAAAGLAVRYVGVAGTLAAVVMGGLRGGTPRERAAAMAQAGLPSLFFVLWWSRRVDTSGEAIREFGVQAGMDRVVAQLAGLAAEWPIPRGLMSAVWPGGATLIGAVVLGVGAILVWYASREPEWKQEPRKAVVRSALVYMACYLSVVVASRLFADPRIPFDARIFFPVLVLSTVLAIAAAVSVARSRGRPGWTVLGIVACGWAVAASSEVRQGVTAVNEYGLYFTSVGWADDPVLRWVVDRSAPYATVYSNEPAMIYFLTGRHAKSLPLIGEDVDAFARQLDRMPGPVVFIAPSHVTDVAPQLLVDRLAVERVVGSGMAALYLPTASVPNP